MIWFLFKMLFSKAGFSKSIKRMSNEQLKEYQARAEGEGNYELAAYIKYYLSFKEAKASQKTETI